MIRECSCRISPPVFFIWLFPSSCGASCHLSRHPHFDKGGLEGIFLSCLATGYMIVAPPALRSYPTFPLGPGMLDVPSPITRGVRWHGSQRLQMMRCRLHVHNFSDLAAGLSTMEHPSVLDAESEVRSDLLQTHDHGRGSPSMMASCTLSALTSCRYPIGIS